MDYDYEKAVYDDVKAAVEYDGYLDDTDNFDNFDDFREDLYDNLWIDDGVTGNGSGSYTADTYEAEDYICHNWDLFKEACGEFGEDEGEQFKRGIEMCDVTIRCYLLGQCLDEVLEDLNIEEKYFKS